MRKPTTIAKRLVADMVRFLLEKPSLFGNDQFILWILLLIDVARKVTLVTGLRNNLGVDFGPILVFNDLHIASQSIRGPAPLLKTSFSG
jgi:hypothetical protein